MCFCLFRILYGRMKNKTGSKTQGKSASGTRMAIVLRFLAGTQPEEIQIFLDLLFEPVRHFKNGNYQLPLTLIPVVCGELLTSQATFPTLLGIFLTGLFLSTLMAIFLLKCSSF